MPQREIQVMPVSELLAMEFPANESILGNNLIDKSGAVLVSGPQKVGKSLFATQLALSLAARQSFLGFEVGPQEYKSLVLQAEVAPKRMQQRLVRQVQPFPEGARRRVLNACVFSSVKLDTEEGFNIVQAWVEQYHPNLLVVDPLTNFHTGDENEAQHISRLTTALDYFREQGVAVVLVHHHGKNSSARSNVGHKARGSSVLPGWYDSHLSLEWAVGKSVRLKFELRHDETPADMVLKLNAETLLFEPQNDEASQISLVLGAIRDEGAAEAETVGQRCGKSRQWANEWLNKACEEGRLVQHGQRPIIYSLPVQPSETRVDVTPNGFVLTTNTAEEPGVFVDGEEVVFG